MQGVGGYFSETVFELYKDLGVVVIDRERAAIGTEVVIAQDGVELVVQGILG